MTATERSPSRHYVLPGGQLVQANRTGVAEQQIEYPPTGQIEPVVGELYPADDIADQPGPAPAPAGALHAGRDRHAATPASPATPVTQIRYSIVTSTRQPTHIGQVPPTTKTPPATAPATPIGIPDTAATPRPSES